MSTIVNVIRPVSVSAPRGARWAAWAVLKLWSAFDQSLAQTRATAQRRSRALEAQRARRIAEQLERVDYRIAREVQIAADRHEQGL